MAKKTNVVDRSKVKRNNTLVLNAVKARMKELGWTKYRLAMALLPKRISPVTVYDYLRGESEMTAGKLGHVLEAIGLKIVVDSEWKEADHPPASYWDRKDSRNPRRSKTTRKQA